MSNLVEQVKFGNTGIKISPIIVGCMSYGSKHWGQWIEDDKEKVFTLLKHCYDRGLRTFDTADVYSDGQSEILLGEFLKKYKIQRETVVILSKTFFPLFEEGNRQREVAHTEEELLAVVNQRGLSRKHILEGVKRSVVRLGTYIDVLQIHRFDHDTPIKETMKALNDVIERGDVRYIGASSMLPTEFVEMQAVADKNGWFQFISVQSYYNLLYREDERDLMKYCKKHNIALTPWSPNARGLLTRPIGTESERYHTDLIIKIRNMQNIEPHEAKIIARVEELSKKKNVSMATISTAWVLSKGCFPIVGMSKIERIDEIIEALNVNFTEEELTYLEELYKPRNFVY